MNHVGYRRSISSAILVAAYVDAVISALAIHWALSPVLIPVGALIGLALFSLSLRYNWRVAVGVILTLPLAFVTELFLVANLVRCSRWLCL